MDLLALKDEIDPDRMVIHGPVVDIYRTADRDYIVATVMLDRHAYRVHAAKACDAVELLDESELSRDDDAYRARRVT